MIPFLACFVGSYLLGAIPFGFLLGKLKGVDIRQIGSGNIGATNLTRAAGRRWGIAAFLLDFLKGLVAVLVTGWLIQELHTAQTAAVGETVPLSAVHAQILSGIAAVLGHMFPVYLRFRGGKGVATAFGVMTGLLWLSALVTGVVWCVLYLSTRIVSVASVMAAVAFPVTVWMFCRTRSNEEFLALAALACAMSALILIRHRANIHRLFIGKENRF